MMTVFSFFLTGFDVPLYSLVERSTETMITCKLAQSIIYIINCI